MSHVLVKMLEYHDTNIKGHSERVAWLSMKIAEFMGMDKESICKIYWAGYLHDVGKIFVPQSILNKQTKLSYEEYEVVKEHPVKSAEILTEILCPEEIIEIVKYHHERWDGRGYPEGLRNFDIPLGSRIVAVADAYDAMISPRSYRKPLSVEKAIEELKSNSNSQFDPNVVEIFLRIITYDRILMPYNFGSVSLYRETPMTK
ncbi:MAG: HD-GYP domain-containing protein [Thermotogaceae bacterium]|nr:HD-GYP domain-containing protein [Thermotogaceae bacterium]